jgi:hypothetical protein
MSKNNETFRFRKKGIDRTGKKNTSAIMLRFIFSEAEYTTIRRAEI